MTYHKDFWVAVAAAAPIIALATQVGITQSARSVDSFRSTFSVSRPEVFRQLERRGRRIAGFGFLASLGNLFLQTIALFLALLSLAGGGDATPTGFAIALLIIGLVLIMMTATSAADLSDTRELVDMLETPSGSGSERDDE